MRDGRRAVQNQHAREDPQRVQAFARQRDTPHEPQQGSPADEAKSRAHAHLEYELTRDLRERTAAERSGGQQAHQQGDADRVVRPGLALQNRRGAAGYLALSQDGEHDGGVGRRDGCADQQRDVPAETEPEVRHGGDGRRRQEGPGDPHHDDGSGGGPKSPPADVHAAVEQDAQQRHGDDAFDGALRWRAQAGHGGCGDGGHGQEQRRCGNP